MTILSQAHLISKHRLRPLLVRVVNIKLCFGNDQDIGNALNHTMVHSSLSERIIDCDLGVNSRDEFGDDFWNCQAGVR